MTQQSDFIIAQVQQPKATITYTDVLNFYNEHINTTAELTMSDVVNYFDRINNKTKQTESESGC